VAHPGQQVLIFVVVVFVREDPCTRVIKLKPLWHTEVLREVHADRLQRKDLLVVQRL